MARPTPRIDPTAYVAAGATVTGDVELGARSSVWPGAVIRADLETVRVGEDSNVQDNAVLHADPGQPCHVGRRVTVGHAAVVHGCTIEDDVLVGIGAIVLNGAVVGRGSVLAAGTLVVEGSVVPPRSVVIGVPGRSRPLENQELMDRADRNWRAYVELAQRELAARDEA